LFNAMTGQQINTLFVTKDLGVPYDQIFDVSIRRRQIVGQASGAVRYILGFFENHCHQVRLIALGAAGGTHARGVSTDYDEFHGILLRI
jgi:hypothetical protein